MLSTVTFSSNVLGLGLVTNVARHFGMGGGRTDGIDSLPGLVQKVGKHTILCPRLRENKAVPSAVPVNQGIRRGRVEALCAGQGTTQLPVCPTGV